MPKTAYLILENGKIFKGKAFGAEREALGELVFNTGMTGYLEILTDSSSYGQIILQTFPLVGNYGKISADFESNSVKAAAYIVRTWCEEPSNFRCEGNLDTFLKSENIPGLYGIDTRAVTKVIRDNESGTGTMNCKIAHSADNIDFDEIKNHKTSLLIENVSCSSVQEFKVSGNKYRVLILDYGMKESLKQRFLRGGCDVIVAPYNTSAEQIKALAPNGIVISHGPGDAADYSDIISSVKTISDLGIPMLGIGFGHRLLALAHGFQTQKMKHAHRGANQPVKDLKDGRLYITNQNHGYTVAADSVNKDVACVSFENVTDKGCEGLEYTAKPIFSTEFYPEPIIDSAQNTSFLFDKFIAGMGKA